MLKSSKQIYKLRLLNAKQRNTSGSPLSEPVMKVFTRMSRGVFSGQFERRGTMNIELVSSSKNMLQKYCVIGDANIVMTVGALLVCVWGGSVRQITFLIRLLYHIYINTRNFPSSSTLSKVSFRVQCICFGPSHLNINEANCQWFRCCLILPYSQLIQTIVLERSNNK